MGCFWATASVGETPKLEPVVLKVGIDSKNVYFALKNVSNLPVKIYNQWGAYDRGFVPSNVDIYLLDKMGNSLKGNEDGLWHHGAKREEMIMQTPPDFENLLPGKQMRVQVPITFFTERLRHEYLGKSFQMRIVCRVYHTDRNFEKSVYAESKWIPVSTRKR